MPEERNPLTADRESAPRQCTHPPHLNLNVHVPGRQGTLSLCQGCGLVKSAAGSPWREADQAESAVLPCTCPREQIDTLYRDLLTHRPECPRYKADRRADAETTTQAIEIKSAAPRDEGAEAKAPPPRVAGRALESTNKRSMTAINAATGWMDRQQALNLVAWLSVIADLKDEEILAARRQVEDT